MLLSDIREYFKSGFITVGVVFIIFDIFFSLLHSESTLCNLYYCFYSNNVLLIIGKLCLSEIKLSYLVSN